MVSRVCKRKSVLVLGLVLALAGLLAARPGQAQGESSLSLLFVGQVGGTTEAVYVSGDYAYIGLGPRLAILDISDPSQPRELGRSDTLAGFVYAVQVVGDYAYVAAGEAGLRILSVADKAHPAEVGFYDPAPPIHADRVHVVDDYAYVADGFDGLHIISVANKANPSQTGFYDIDFPARRTCMWLATTLM
ncbi:MAG: LVIVD repeat-containing protein [Anaerolineae bacterium]